MVEDRAAKSPSTLRQRILAFVGALIVLSVLGSTVSLYRITEVNRLLDGINRVSVPLGRLLAQVQSDAELYKREAERGLGSSHWGDSHWKARPVPRWLVEVLGSEISRIAELVKTEGAWVPGDARSRWEEWASRLDQSFQAVQGASQDLLSALDKRDPEAAERSYGIWLGALEDWRVQVQWGVAEYERTFRQNFALAESRVAELRTGLEMILVVVVSLSLLFLWLGERALRPLGELTRLASEIARRGLRKEDKALLPEFPLSRSDEVSQLAREFHRMATALLEREKTVETQKERLVEQNKQLRDLGELQERLRRAENLAAVGRMSAQVAHEVRNPLHSIGLEAEVASDMAARIGVQAAPLRQSLQSILMSVDRLEKITENYLKLSRLSAGEKREVNLGEVLESVLATYASACESGGVRVDWVREAGSALGVLGDRDLLEQIFGNLLRNSLQALEGVSGERKISWKMGNTEAGGVFVRIEDSGPGISSELREKLFTPFFTTKAQGTGLGLSFVKKVAEDHHGQVRCVEPRSGRGACFELVLPVLSDRLQREEPSIPELPSELSNAEEACP